MNQLILNHVASKSMENEIEKANEFINRIYDIKKAKYNFVYDKYCNDLIDESSYEEIYLDSATDLIKEESGESK